MEINQPCPNTWFLESILVTIFCCIPFGVSGIIHATKMPSLYAAGKVDEAAKSSTDAKKCTIASVIVVLREC